MSELVEFPKPEPERRVERRLRNIGDMLWIAFACWFFADIVPIGPAIGAAIAQSASVREGTWPHLLLTYVAGAGIVTAVIIAAMLIIDRLSAHE